MKPAPRLALAALVVSLTPISQAHALSCEPPASDLHLVGVTHPLRARGFAIVKPDGTGDTLDHSWGDASLERASRDGAFERVPFDVEVADEWTLLLVPKEPLAVGDRYRLHHPPSQAGGAHDVIVFETTIERFDGFEPSLDLDLMDVRQKQTYPFGDIRYVEASVIIPAQWYRALRVEFVVDGEPFRPPSMCPDGLRDAGADLTKDREMLFTSVSYPEGEGDLDPKAHAVFARLVLPGAGVAFETQEEVFTLAPPEEKPPPRARATPRAQGGCASARSRAPAPPLLALLVPAWLMVTRRPRRHQG